MLSRKIDAATWFIRLDPGEELIGEIESFCRRESIQLGHFTGIGAMAEVELSAFLHDEKRYARQSFAGSLEIISMQGHITVLDGDVHLHIHMAMGDEELAMKGGHLHRAVINPTAEIILHAHEGIVERTMDDASGLYLMRL